MFLPYVENCPDEVLLPVRSLAVRYSQGKDIDHVARFYLDTRPALAVRFGLDDLLLVVSQWAQDDRLLSEVEAMRPKKN